MAPESFIYFAFGHFYLKKKKKIIANKRNKFYFIKAWKWNKSTKGDFYNSFFCFINIFLRRWRSANPQSENFLLKINCWFLRRSNRIDIWFDEHSENFRVQISQPNFQISLLYLFDYADALLPNMNVCKKCFFFLSNYSNAVNHVRNCLMSIGDWCLIIKS